MPDIEPEVGKVLKACGLDQSAVWKHKQSGKWIVYHWALEKAAAKKKIKFDQPTIVHADPAGKLATIIVTGHLGEQCEWSFGEAAPYNTTQSYPFAMAEKRGKDRVILKLIGLHGLAYSEEEADDFKEPATKVQAKHGGVSQPIPSNPTENAATPSAEAEASAPIPVPMDNDNQPNWAVFVDCVKTNLDACGTRAEVTAIMSANEPARENLKTQNEPEWQKLQDYATDIYTQKAA